MFNDPIAKLIENRAYDDHDESAFIAHALLQIAFALKALGNNNAATDVGAIEGLGMTFRDGFTELAAATDTSAAISAGLTEIADAISGGFTEVAEAIRDSSPDAAVIENALTDMAEALKKD